LEKILDDISFNAPDREGEIVKINKAYVDKHLGDIIKEKDLSKFIL
jgi:ATP-dependent HslUV protease ATP-binding subunit HslU